MRAKAGGGRPPPDTWPASSILGSTGWRLGAALAAIGVLWAGVLWVTLTPPGKPEVASAPSATVASQTQPAQAAALAAVPQRVGLRALALAGESVGLSGSFDR